MKTNNNTVNEMNKLEINQVFETPYGYTYKIVGFDSHESDGETYHGVMAVKFIKSREAWSKRQHWLDLDVVEGWVK